MLFCLGSRYRCQLIIPWDMKILHCFFRFHLTSDINWVAGIMVDICGCLQPEFHLIYSPISVDCLTVSLHNQNDCQVSLSFGLCWGLHLKNGHNASAAGHISYFTGNPRASRLEPCNSLHYVYKQSHDFIVFCFVRSWWSHAQRSHVIIITSLLRQNDAATSFWHNNYVIITPCVHWMWICTRSSGLLPPHWGNRRILLAPVSEK